MSVLVAVFFVALGVYTVSRAPRSLPHWLAGLSALGFVLTEALFPFGNDWRGIAYAIVGALCICSGERLIHTGAQVLFWCAIICGVGLIPLTLGKDVCQGLIFLVCFLALFLMPLWGGVILLFAASEHGQTLEIRFWHGGLLALGIAFTLSFIEWLQNASIDFDGGPIGYRGVSPLLHDLSMWLAPALVAFGIAATCLAVARLLPSSRNSPHPFPHSSDTPNPL